MQVEDHSHPSTTADVLVAEPLNDDDRSHLVRRFQSVRNFSEALCSPLVPEDYVIQSMPDVSPTKWHLAHTSWFFETFILRPHFQQYGLFHSQFPFLFNSYYVQAGERHCRARRGLLSRPTVKEVYGYRAHVDEHMVDLLQGASADLFAVLQPLVEIGIHHEQQHQELMLTDLKHVFSINPLYPAYQSHVADPVTEVAPIAWVNFDEGVREVGHKGGGFSFDNELPRHKTYIQNFALASRLVTNGEYIEFMEAGGYERPELWLSAGWATVQEEDWQAPMYWEKKKGRWYMFTLSGLQPVNLAEPVCHVSYFEADAYARWYGARLATEQEWEIAAASLPVEGNFVDAGYYHPRVAAPDAGLQQMYGEVWQWTQSQYTSYPGYKPVEGALGEYNGKFMCNQFVLRGASCATSQSHARVTYRNFFPPESRWQFMGIRLAK
ncbi:MAG: ergothioneine biosynthesis protein EgtB [Bacteroidota bacterium]